MSKASARNPVVLKPSSYLCACCSILVWGSKTKVKKKLAIEAGGTQMPAFTSFFTFLLLPRPLRLLNEQLSWRLRCSVIVLFTAPRELSSEKLPAPFLISKYVGPCP